MQGACGKWSWQGTTPQCEGLDRARATDMWWALARAGRRDGEGAQYGERNVALEQRMGGRQYAGCVWEVGMARHDTTV